MIDHGGLDGQIAFLRVDQLVVRGAVLAREQHAAALQSRLRLLDVPAVHVQAGQADPIDAVQGAKIVHGGGGCKIDAIERGIQGDHVHIQPPRHPRFLGHDQEPTAGGDVKKDVPPVVLRQGELIGVS